MNRYEALMARLASGEQILIDGATGTEVERRGVPRVKHAWNGGGAKTHPDVLRAIHLDYIETGAQVIISNTFATSRHNLQEAGWEADFDLLNRRGVELAVEARTQSGQDHVVVAGGISHWDFNSNPPSLAALRVNSEDQAAIMAEAGADLIMLEMMAHTDKMIVVLEAAQKTGLPIWAGLSCDLDQDGTPKLWHQGTLAEAIAMLVDKNIPLINIMHSEVDYIDACLDVMQSQWDGLTGVYAHSGEHKDGLLLFDTVISPHDYAAAADRWLTRGVNVIGGCCGVGVSHMQLLKAQMACRNPQKKI